MTNQQLLDFIKSQLQLGLTKEKISNELSSNGWSSQNIEEGFKSIDNSTPLKGKKNFWVFFPLILSLLSIISFFPALSSNLSLLGFFVLLGFLYSLIPAIIGIIFSVILFLNPKRTLKITFNIISTLVLVPIIYLNFVAYWFVHVTGPAMDVQYHEEVKSELATINGKSFIPLAVNNNLDVLLPGNIIIRDAKMLNLNKSDIIGFDEIFKKEIIDKKKEVQVVLDGAPYTVVFTAGPSDSWLEQGKSYRLVEGNLSVDGQIIDQNFILSNSGK